MRGWLFGLGLTVAAAAYPSWAETSFVAVERCVEMPVGSAGKAGGEEPWRTEPGWRGIFACDTGTELSAPEAVIKLAFRQGGASAITMLGIPRRQLPMGTYDVYGPPLLFVPSGEPVRFGGDFLMGEDGGLEAALSSLSTISVSIRPEPGWAGAKRGLFDSTVGRDVLFEKTDDNRDGLQRYVSRVPLPIDRASMLASELAAVGLVVGDCNSSRWKVEPGSNESGPEAICRLEWLVSGDLVGRLDFRQADLGIWVKLVESSNVMLKGWIAEGTRK